MDGDRDRSLVMPNKSDSPITMFPKPEDNKRSNIRTSGTIASENKGKKKRGESPPPFKKRAKYLVRLIMSVLLLVLLTTLAVLYTIGLFVGHIDSLEKQAEYFLVLTNIGKKIWAYLPTVLTALVINVITQMLFSNKKVIKRRLNILLIILLIVLSSVLGVAAAGAIGERATKKILATENTPEAQTDDSQSVDSESEREYIDVDISENWFMTRIYAVDMDYDAVCQGANQFINKTSYENKLNTSKEYKGLVNKAAIDEEIIKKDYPVYKYSGELDLDEELLNMHINYDREMLSVLQMREEANGIDTTYENNKEIANYYFSLGDTNHRLKNHENAYRYYKQSANYYVIALQLSLSSPNGKEKALYVIGQLSKIYGGYRLQDVRLLDFAREESVFLNHIKSTEDFYRKMIQYVDMLNFSE